jgi:hypothetical protein
MIEVEIWNFQSIEHDVVVIDGFTAIVGQSNIGKSAIVRAVKAALTGAPADTFVRHGKLCLRLVRGTKTCKCACKVHIRTEGLDLLWEKGDAVNRYTFNGKEYTAVNRGMPDFLKDQFDYVKLGRDDSVLLQVSDQFRPLFLVDQPGSVVADVLSDVARLDHINVAIGMAEKDRRAASATRKVREKDVTDLTLKLSTFDGLDTFAGQVQWAEQSYEKLQKLLAHLDEVQRFADQVLGSARQVKALEGVKSIVAPDVEPLREKSTTYTSLFALHGALVERESAAEFMQPVLTIAAPDIEGIQKLHEAYRRLEGWVAKLRLLKEVRDRWQQSEKAPLPETEPLTAVLQKHDKVAGLRTRYESALSTIKTLEDEIAAAALEETGIQAELDALGVCPTCERPLGVGHQHMGVAANA